MWRNFWKEETAAIVSIEIVLIITVAVLSLIVGLSELAFGVVQELDDIGNAVGKLTQSYEYTGFHSYKTVGGTQQVKSRYWGSRFRDAPDACDGNCSGVSEIACCDSTMGGGGMNNPG